MSLNTEYAQHAQHKKSNGAVKTVLVALITLFLAYSVQKHWITEFFISVLSLFFDNFTIHTVSYISDIALLIFLSVFLFGLYCLFKFFMVPLIVVTIIMIAVIAFNDDDPLKPVKIQEKLHHTGNYGG